MLAIWIGLGATCLSQFLGIFGVIYYQTALWITLSGAAGTLGLALWEWLEKNSGVLKKARLVYSFGLAVVIFVAGAICIKLFPLEKTDHDNLARDKSAFNINIHAILTGTDNRTVMVYVRGDTIYPIDVALYMQMTNTQSIRSKIMTYSVQASKTVDGPWKSLIPLSINQGELCFIDSDISEGVCADPITNFYELLKTEAFDPQETKAGWAFFRRPDMDLSGIRFFRFTAQDTAGLSSVQILSMPSGKPLSEADLSQGGFKGPARKEDLSNYRLHKTFPPYPD